MAEYIASNGTPITEEMIDQWADEAERAWQGDDVEIIPFEGRPWETRTEPMKARTVRVPDSLWNLTVADARRRNVSVSEAVREALASHLQAAA